MKHLKWLIVGMLFLVMLSPSQVNAIGFTDVPSSHWAHGSITKLSNANIIKGYDNGTYLPERKVTRAQAAKILSSALKLPLESNFQMTFQDVPPTHWAYKEIRSLTEKGVFSNTTQFNPNAPLTRAQMAKILSISYKLILDNNHEVAFNDIPNSNWEHPYVIVLAELDITTGVTPHLFKPLYHVTRGQMATFVDRAMIFNQKRNEGVIKYNASTKSYVDTTVSADSELAKETARLVNLERAKANLQPLAMDAPLAKIAVIKAQDMVKNDYFAHTSPTYGDPWDMATQFGYSYRYFGENIAFGHTTAANVVKGWMNSPGHKANILNPNYTNIGAGIEKNSDGRIYWVHMFSSK